MHTPPIFSTFLRLKRGSSLKSDLRLQGGGGKNDQNGGDFHIRINYIDFTHTHQMEQCDRHIRSECDVQRTSTNVGFFF